MLNDKLPFVDKSLIEIPENAFARGKGREFGRWIDNVRGGARSNGYNEGDLIENPIYVIESLLRDEMFVKRDLRILSSADTTHFVCTDVDLGEDDDYNNAEFYNATTLVKRYITDYVGATNTFTISSADAAMVAGNNFYLTNIGADYFIDETTFDAIGNTTNGKRNGWKVARSINTKQNIQNLISELLFESHCVLFDSTDESGAYSKIKVKALDKMVSAPIITNLIQPLISDGIPQASIDFSDLGQIFTSFKLFYHIDPAKGDYLKSISVDENGYSNPSGGTTLTNEHKNLCGYAEKLYKINNPFVYSSNWIYDDATAEYFLDKKIRWFTEQRLRLHYASAISYGVIDFITLEIGDQVMFTSATDILPDRYSYQGTVQSSHKFMVYGKTIVTNPQGVPYILWDFIDMGI